MRGSDFAALPVQTSSLSEFLRGVPNSPPFKQGNFLFCEKTFPHEFCEAGSLSHTKIRKAGNLNVLPVEIFE